MYRWLRIVALAPVLNDETSVGPVVRRTPRPLVDEVVVIDRGSSDASAAAAHACGATLLSLPKSGVGAALRAGLRYAVERGFDVAVVMSPNGTAPPEEISRLVDPIADGEADFVQGSRYLKRSSGLPQLPLHRRVATRVHPLLFSLAARHRVTESTGGFRAIHRRVLEDRRLNLSQPWLDANELEPYLYLRAIQLGYQTVEVPISVVAPPKELAPPAAKPAIGWWSTLRPVVLVGLGLRK